MPDWGILMDASKDTLQQGLLQAMKAEGDGHNFYKMAGINTNDLKGRDIFEMLAREEAEHFQFLKLQYEHLLDTGVLSKAIKLSGRTILDDLSPIFSENIKTRIKDAHMEMSALSIGVQLELGAVQFYSAQAKLHDSDEAAKSFYNELTVWEQGHYSALLRQQESLRDDYWSAGGFSPF